MPPSPVTLPGMTVCVPCTGDIQRECVRANYTVHQNLPQEEGTEGEVEVSEGAYSRGLYAAMGDR